MRLSNQSSTQPECTLGDVELAFMKSISDSRDRDHIVMVETDGDQGCGYEVDSRIHYRENCHERVHHLQSLLSLLGATGCCRTLSTHTICFKSPKFPKNESFTQTIYTQGRSCLLRTSNSYAAPQNTSTQTTHSSHSSIILLADTI